MHTAEIQTIEQGTSSEELAYMLLEEARLRCESLVEDRSEADPDPDCLSMTGLYGDIGIAGYYASARLDPARRKVLLAQAHARCHCGGGTASSVRGARRGDSSGDPHGRACPDRDRSARSHAPGAHPHDVGMRDARLDVRVATVRAPVLHQRSDNAMRVRLELDSVAGSVTLVRSVIRTVARAAEPRPALVDDLRTAVSEACNNVVLHAYPAGPGR